MKSRIPASEVSTWHSWPPRIVLIAFIFACSTGSVYGQTGSSSPNTLPPAATPTGPAELQPGHTIPPPAGTATQSGPQSIVPNPLPPGTGSDTPGGSARNGVIAPPGTAGGNPQVVPK